MTNLQLTGDKLAIALSTICVIHCLFVPSFLILTSGFLITSLDNEGVHILILLIAFPISISSLLVGFRNHKVLSVFSLGISGLLILTLAVLLGVTIFGELGEKILTLIGSILVAYAHFRNQKVCRDLECSSCHEE